MGGMFQCFVAATKHVSAFEPPAATGCQLLTIKLSGLGQYDPQATKAGRSDNFKMMECHILFIFLLLGNNVRNKMLNVRYYIYVYIHTSFFFVGG